MEKYALKNALHAIMQQLEGNAHPIALIQKPIQTIQQMHAKNVIFHAKDAMALPVMTA